jgi:negative regulator of flagellin synthesis FlgM
VTNRIKGPDGGSIGAGGNSPVEKIRGSNAVGSAGSGSTTAGGSGSDSVQITDSARAMASLSQAVNAEPDVDTARVAALQQAIGSGQYSIDPQRIANRLLQTEQDLGSAQQ